MTGEQLIDQGVALGKQERFDESVAVLRQAVALEPNNARGHLNLAVALLAGGHAEEALGSIDRAITLRGDVVLAYYVRTKVLLALNRTSDAAAAASRGLQLAPSDPELHAIHGRALLTAGDFKRGWAEYEWRWKCPSFKESRRHFPQPQWTGGKIADKTILVHHEQGFGDTIQFVRYAALLAERGADVIVQCPRELSDLVRRMPTSPHAIPSGDNPPAFDLHIAMMSLPLAFGTTLKTIPANVPYMSASPKVAAVWAQRMQQDGEGFRVGIAWMGRKTYDYGREKSMSLASFTPLAQAPGVLFYSLQKWDSDHEAATPPPGMRLVDHTRRLFDFSDSAALIANLDLVICVDTAIAHLAGAMGRPLWVLLPFAPEFRWLLERSDTPWYPTMRLFRQPRRGDWASVLEQVSLELSRLAASRNQG